MSKVLDAILELKKDFNSDWRPQLDRIGILEEVKQIYQKKWPTNFCNQVLAFIVLSYDNQSGWIEIHKDRWDNKANIAAKLGMNINEKKVKEIIENNQQVVVDLVAWFIDYQKDWRWDAILACFEYASEMMRFAKVKTADQVFVNEEEGGKKIFQTVDIDSLAKGNLAKGKNIQEAINQRQKGEELLEQIKQDFVTLDTAMHKEGKRKPTDLKNIFSWESYIKDLRGHE